MLVRELMQIGIGFKEEEHNKPIILIVDASGLTISKRKEIILKRNGYVRKRSLSNCILLWTKNL
jgi:hypothetical protein